MKKDKKDEEIIVTESELEDLRDNLVTFTTKVTAKVSEYRKLQIEHNRNKQLMTRMKSIIEEKNSELKNKDEEIKNIKKKLITMENRTRTKRSSNNRTKNEILKDISGKLTETVKCINEIQKMPVYSDDELDKIIENEL